MYHGDNKYTVTENLALIFDKKIYSDDYLILFMLQN